MGIQELDVLPMPSSWGTHNIDQIDNIGRSTADQQAPRRVDGAALSAAPPRSRRYRGELAGPTVGSRLHWTFSPFCSSG
jgi:hypothetical protein